MPRNNPDKTIRDKINGLGRLPAPDSFERQPAWETLYARLQEKPRKRRSGWYYAAAAAVLAAVCLLGATYLFRPGHLENPATGPVSLQVLIPGKRPAEAVPRPVGAVVADMPQSGAVATTRKKAERHAPVPVKEIFPALPREIQDGGPPGNGATMAGKAVPAPPLKTALATPAVIPVKRLPVVCLNEIEDNNNAAAPAPAFKKERSFAIRLFSPLRENDSSFVTEDDNNILKIKLVSKN